MYQMLQLHQQHLYLSQHHHQQNNTTKIEPKRHIECIKVSLLSPRKATSKSRHRSWGKLATLTVIEKTINRNAKGEMR